jgi:antitoxin component YwqK of YwqJK toxin-antitoxin module
MKKFLTPILLLTLLFLTFALGQSLNDWGGKGKGIFCGTTGVGCPESVEVNDLVRRDDIYYKKFSDAPFTGKITGRPQGSFKNGKRHGPWVNYHDNGQLMDREFYKDGEHVGLWVSYFENGKLLSKMTHKDGMTLSVVIYNEDGTEWGSFDGNYKDGMKVE